MYFGERRARPFRMAGQADTVADIVRALSMCAVHSRRSRALIYVGLYQLNKYFWGCELSFFFLSLLSTS